MKNNIPKLPPPFPPVPLNPTTPSRAAWEAMLDSLFDYADVENPGQLVWHRVGNVIRLYGKEYVVTRVNESCAHVKCLSRTQETVVDRLHDRVRVVMRSAHETDVCASTERGNVIRRIDFHGGQNGPGAMSPPADVERTQGSEANEVMLNKNKKTTARGDGKIAFVTALLLAGGLTKSAIVQKTLKHFPGSKEKTIKNTVQWCASYYIPTKLGKKSKHVDEPRASASSVRETKPAKGSKAATKPKAKGKKKGANKPATAVAKAEPKAEPSAPAAATPPAAPPPPPAGEQV